MLTWAKMRNRYPKCLLVLCSSAGEYEQAKPIIGRFQDRGDTAVFILFFSNSGIKFARSQGESVPFALVNSDRPSYWREVCAELRPDAFLSVRYELWPGMMKVLPESAPVYLIDGVESPDLKKSYLAKKLRAYLLKNLRKIFVVSESDKLFFESVLKVPGENLELAGDTKYDRVLERIGHRQEKLSRLSQELGSFLNGRRVIVLGSAWPKDVEAFASILPALKLLDPELAVIIAPHDLSEANVSQIMASLKTWSIQRVSQEGYALIKARLDILIVDVLGDLPELYGCADLAWVGGAMHYRVHNVLEPACRGLYVCFGPRYETSQEARVLVHAGLAKVIHTGSDFIEWYKTLSFAERPPHRAMIEAVSKQKGASDLIFGKMLATWQGSDR